MKLDIQSISAIAIDLNDTLISSDVHLFSSKSAEYLSRDSCQISPADFYGLYRKRYLEYSMGNYESDEEFFGVILAECPGVVLNSATTNHLRELLFSSVSPFPDSSMFLAVASQRYRVILSSNFVAQWAKRIVSDNRWDSYFSSILVSSDCRFRKPAARFFQNLVDTCDVRSSDEILVVGDSLINDIIGARNCGLKAIHLRRNGGRRSELLDESITVRSLSAVLSLLEGQGSTP